jgi:hypothetical protein
MLAIVAVLGAYALYRPAANWDIVAYVATAHSWQGMSGQALSDATYADLRAYLTPAQSYDVTGAGDPSLSGNVYRHTVATDPTSLQQQIPFYAVKPLYLALMLALDAVGVALPLSTVVISVLAYAATGLLLFAWIARHRRPLTALVLAGLIVASPPFAVLASLSTPDALALALIAGAAFAFAELRRPAVMIALLALAVLARPNAAVFAILLLGAGVAAADGSRVRLHPLVALGAAVLVGGLVLGVSRLVGGYSYTLLFSHTFFGLLAYPARGAPPLALSDVLHLYAFLAGKLTTTVLPLFGLLGVVALALRVRSLAEVRRDPASLLVVASLAAAVAGWLAFPSSPERMLVGSFLVIAAVLAASASAGETAVVGAPGTADTEPSPTPSPVVAAST